MIEGRPLCKNITEKEEVTLIAFTLQTMQGDKNATMDAMEQIQPKFLECMREFMQKITVKEPIEIKRYYKDSLKKALINERINLNRRIRNLITQIDIEKFDKKL